MAEAAIREQEDGTWLLEGEVNHRTVVALRQQGERCLEKGEGPVRFDLSGVTQINTAGLTLLLCWRRKADQLGVEVELANIPSELYSIANVSDLAAVLE